MNKKGQALLLTGFFSVFVMTALSCASGGAERGGAVWADVQDKEWALNEISGASGAAGIDRTKNADIYTLKFDAERASGMGAPNRYTAPYTAGEGGVLSIGMIAGTKMASLFEPEGLKENEYFAFLGRVKSWALRDGKLELYTTGEDGAEAVLVYLQK